MTRFPRFQRRVPTRTGAWTLRSRCVDAHQVLHNRESSALQYAMRDRLTALAWSNIDTVDDDFGRPVGRRVEGDLHFDPAGGPSDRHAPENIGLFHQTETARG